MQRRRRDRARLCSSSGRGGVHARDAPVARLGDVVHEVVQRARRRRADDRRRREARQGQRRSDRPCPPRSCSVTVPVATRGRRRGRAGDGAVRGCPRRCAPSGRVRPRSVEVLRCRCLRAGRRRNPRRAAASAEQRETGERKLAVLAQGARGVRELAQGGAAPLGRARGSPRRPRPAGLPASPCSEQVVDHETAATRGDRGVGEHRAQFARDRDGRVERRSSSPRTRRERGGVEAAQDRRRRILRAWAA